MTQTVNVVKIIDETPEVRSFELVPVDASPVAFSAGAHIDVHLPGGVIRQYSILNGPQDRYAYLIAVKREPKSRGGSEAMHKVSVGDTLQISAPRNNFELSNDEAPVLLLAGGIGITPVLCMGRHLQAQGREFALHLFARNAEFAPFLDALAKFPTAPVHLGLVPPTLGKVLSGILADPAPGAHLYFCGPGPFMDLVEELAARAGWPAGRIHLERFSVDPDTLDSSGEGFEVILKQSGTSIWVEEGQTIIDAMEVAGISHLTSCEQGVCGTCLTTIIEGEPDHRDQYLSNAEKSSGKLIMPCVSRCKGKRLVLDL